MTLELLAALAKLTPWQREVLIDHALLGRTITQIAVDQGRTRQAVQQTLRKGRFKLMRELREELAW